ncbi:MAG TPA: ABC transporter substrate-binding protein [Marmoricola sp.]|nr:ABC transporter substrate-binding protein [Marmoricola sp.]
MTRSRTTATRRLLLALLVVPLALTAACGGGFNTASGSGGTVVIVGQKFTEADIMTQLYKQLLDHAGFQTEVKNLGTRDVYLDPLEKGDVMVSADYLSSMTDALNKKVNGENAPSVASPDTAATLAKLKQLGSKLGITPLQPAKAEDANAYAVTKQFAAQHHLKTLSDLGRLGQPIALAAASDCPERSDCKLGLEKVYGIKISKVEPLGFDSPETKSALSQGEVQLGQVATTDATLDGLGLVILTDDKNWQNAENLVPVVNSKWLKANPKAADALNKLSDVLTTKDLMTMNAKVDAQRMQASVVAQEYLKQKGLVG